MNSDFYYHLLKRGWSPYIKSWVDWDQELITFPIYTIDGKMVGYQKYNWKEDKTRDNQARYYTYADKAYKNCVVYGLDNCFGYGPVFITEGIWNALRITNCFRDSLAMLCNNPSKQTKQWLKMVYPNRTIVAICDNDEAGKLLGRSADYSFVAPIEYGDINDMSTDECMRFLENITKEIKYLS
jgi:DNA primase